MRKQQFSIKLSLSFGLALPFGYVLYTDTATPKKAEFIAKAFPQKEQEEQKRCLKITRFLKLPLQAES